MPVTEFSAIVLFVVLSHVYIGGMKIPVQRAIEMKQLFQLLRNEDGFLYRLRAPCQHSSHRNYARPFPEKTFRHAGTNNVLTGYWEVD
jgi:hypothetical protein